MMAVKELKPEQLTRICDIGSLPFKTTNDIRPLKGAIGHQRAIDALTFGLESRMKGFNIFLLGEPGSGKTSILKKFLTKKALNEPTAPDWIYVHNFDDPNCPKAYSMPTGSAQTFRRDMKHFVEELKRVFTRTPETEGYQMERMKIEDLFGSKEDKAFKKLKRLGRKHELSIERIQGELMIQVIQNGKPLEREEYEQLSSRQRNYYEEKVHELQDEISEFLRTQRKLEREKFERVRRIDKKMILGETEEMVDELKNKYLGVEGIGQWLDALWQHIPEAFRDYLKTQEEPEGMMEAQMVPQKSSFSEFKVKVLVNNHKAKGAPVVFENAPTYNNLLGCMEYREQYGMWQTDLTLIRTGALHNANGGYLVIQVNDLLKSMFAWDALKRALRNREIRIAELDFEQRGRSTVSPKPEPIPLQTKVILIGNYDTYYYLLNMDEDFSRLFKVKAEFDEVVPYNKRNIKRYAAFVSRLVEEDELLPFDASAVARIVQHGSRLADHQKKLSAQFIHIINLVSESNFWAEKSRSKVVSGKHVCNALRQRSIRTGKIEYEMYEQIAEGTILMDLKGKTVGQINGIALYDMGDHAFGIPSRITARTYVGQQGILNIDREVRLSGQIHSKASLILVGIIGGMYAQKEPMALSASVCFEQMYGSIEGDSASCAELFALISSLSRIPVEQGICVTGSLNQQGEVQPIGGVTEKIEGVYRICKAKGLTGRQGVVIPVQNVVNLMLEDEVVEAVRTGKFHIWAIRNVNEGLKAVLGKPAREVHKLVRKRLKEFHTALE